MNYISSSLSLPSFFPIILWMRDMYVLCVPVYEYEHARTMIYMWKSEDNFRCWFISSPLQQISGESLSVSCSHHMSAVIDVCF